MWGKAIGAHMRGKLSFSFGAVRSFSAVHSSLLDSVSLVGVPCSFVIAADGKLIFHFGDTALLWNMNLIGENSHLDVALLSVGGYYTTGIGDAVKAEKLLKARIVVPMHNRSSGLIMADPYEFCRKVKVQVKRMCVVLRLEESLTLD
jgi:L-ascorbate metabolism protein UlaG (beta-lactamase superfamily)